MQFVANLSLLRNGLVVILASHHIVITSYCKSNDHKDQSRNWTRCALLWQWTTKGGHLPHPSRKKNHHFFCRVLNTTTIMRYNMTPSHIIQQNAESQKYWRSAATALQAAWTLVVGRLKSVHLKFQTLLHTILFLAVSTPATNIKKAKSSAIAKFRWMK